MKCRPACVWRREDEGDWNVSASGVFDLQISKKNPSHVHRLFSKLKIADRQIHKAGINLQNWELRVGLPLQKLPCLHFKQTENWSWYTFTLVPKNAEPSAHHTSIAARGGGGSFKRLKLYNSEEHLPIESFVTTNSLNILFWWCEQSWHLLALSQRATPCDTKF